MSFIYLASPYTHEDPGQQYNQAILCKASALWILKLPGWLRSRGVEAERTFALACNIPVVEKAFSA